MRNLYAAALKLTRSTAAKLLISGVWLSCPSVGAGEVTVAVAANFAAPMQKIAAEFEAETGHRTQLAIGSTGAFYTQVRNGAPFEVLLSADDETPARLEREGLAVAGSRFTYAIGRLVLWSARPGFVDSQGDVLRRGNFERIALANPKLAPYGQAAVEAMQRLGVHDALQPKFVQGENIAQTFQFVATGNAALGFVASSQVIGRHPGWLLPESMHAPLRQDAVVLRAGRGNPAAKALADFLKGDKARGIIRAFGYQTP